MIHIWHMFLYIWLISMLNAGKQTIHAMVSDSWKGAQSLKPWPSWLCARCDCHGMLVFLKEGRWEKERYTTWNERIQQKYLIRLIITLPRAIQHNVRCSSKISWFAKNTGIYSKVTTRLSTWQVAAGHDGQAVAALERAELACISCSLEMEWDLERHGNLQRPPKEKGGIRWIREREEGVKEMVIINDVDFTI